jgi:hypothetical protein
MARPETQMLKRQFEGIRPRAAKAWTDNFQGHVFLRALFLSGKLQA